MSARSMMRPCPFDLPVVDLIPTSDGRLAVGHLGPDPLRADFDPALAAANLSADPQRAIVTALLDQRCIAGLGNLWVNELCYLRGLNPSAGGPGRW